MGSFGNWEKVMYNRAVDSDMGMRDDDELLDERESAYMEGVRDGYRQAMKDASLSHRHGRSSSGMSGMGSSFGERGRDRMGRYR